MRGRGRVGGEVVAVQARVRLSGHENYIALGPTLVLPNSSNGFGVGWGYRDARWW